MTPNKLPPLPEPDANAQHAWQFTAAQMNAHAAEALRQSQSLPAGAVADDLEDLVHKLCDRAFGDGLDTRDTYSGHTEVLRRKLIEGIAALQADAREKGEAVRAADAVFAFSAMLTSLPKVVPFGAAAWATPGVELAVAFIKTNGLGECSPDFPGGIKFPDFEGELLSVVERAALATQPAQASEKVPSDDYQRGFHDGYERRHLEVLGALV